MNKKCIIYAIIVFILLLIASVFLINKNNNSNQENEIKKNIIENKVVKNIVGNNREENIAENTKFKILGTYNAERPYGTEAFTYVFSENSVIYVSDAYNDGNYEIEENKIKITYSVTHSPVDGSPMDFVRQPEELSIEDENTLVNSTGTKFYKTSDKTTFE